MKACDPGQVVVFNGVELEGFTLDDFVTIEVSGPGPDLTQSVGEVADFDTEWELGILARYLEWYPSSRNVYAHNVRALLARGAES